MLRTRRRSPLASVSCCTSRRYGLATLRPTFCERVLPTQTSLAMAVESDDRVKLRRQRYSVPYSTFCERTLLAHRDASTRGLTFDMSGGAKGAKRPLGRPLDGGVRPQHVRFRVVFHRQVDSPFVTSTSLFYAAGRPRRFQSLRPFGANSPPRRDPLERH